MTPHDRATSSAASLAAWACLAAALVLAQAATRGLGAGLDGYAVTQIAAVLPFIASLSLAALALLLFDRTRLAAPGAGAPEGAALAVVLLAGLAMRLLHFGAPAILETDHYRYLWDGALVARGFDPYAIAPRVFLEGGEAPAALKALAAEAPAILRGINFPEVRTIYPGVAQAAFALAHLLKPFSIDGLRVVILGFEIASLVLMLALLKRLALSPLVVALYWLNPLVVFSFANQVHIDAALVAFVLAALLAAERGRGALAGAMLAFAAGVKIWPILLAPLLARRLGAPRRILAAALAGATVSALALGPLFLSALRAGSGLTAYAGDWANNNAFYAWASYALFRLLPDGAPGEAALRLALALATVLVALAAARRPVEGARDLVVRALVVASALFYLSPAQFPWYATWFLALAALARDRILLGASVVLPAYFLFFPLINTDRLDLFRYGVAFVHAAPILALLLWRARTGRRPA